MSDSMRGALILGGLVLVLVIGAFAVADNGWQKVSCIGRALVGGVSLSSIHSVCGL